MESGWTRLADRAPELDDLRYDGLVDAYKVSSDSTFQAYGWSFRAIHGRDRRGYYWRPIEAAAADDRHFRYYLRSLRIFG
jgi:hypothetical protein